MIVIIIKKGGVKNEVLWNIVCRAHYSVWYNLHFGSNRALEAFAVLKRGKIHSSLLSFSKHQNDIDYQGLTLGK